MTLVRAKVEVNIPRKRPANASQREKAEARFYAQTLEAVLRHINFAGTISSPEYTVPRRRMNDWLPLKGMVGDEDSLATPAP